MKKCNITVLCSICKKPSDTDGAMCYRCSVALQPDHSYQVQQEELMAHAKHIIMLAHEMFKYDSILLKD